MARVLICEDDPGVARLLALVLGIEGHEAEVVVDGLECTRRLDAPAADLLLLDVMLPGRNGLEVLRDLRGRSEWDDCRVVVLTALDGDEDVWRGWTSGADYYLTKPFDLSHLRWVAESLLRGDPLDPERVAG